MSSGEVRKLAQKTMIGHYQWASKGEPAKLRLIKGDMPLYAAHVPRLRAVVYASDA